jgi:hypothetical protein
METSWLRSDALFGQLSAATDILAPMGRAAVDSQSRSHARAARAGMMERAGSAERRNAALSGFLNRLLCFTREIPQLFNVF